MLLKIKSEQNHFNGELDIGDAKGLSKPSWITIFIGENGTKKSLLLRLVADALSGPGYPKLPGSRKIEIHQSEGSSIKRVVALSGTPLDRFPRLRALPYRRVASNRLVYFGQRASNGVASSGQSAISIVTAFLANRDKLSARSEALAAVFGHLGLKPEIQIKFTATPPHTDLLSSSLHDDDFDMFSELFRDMSKRYADNLMLREIRTVSDERDATAIKKSLTDDAFYKHAFEVLKNLDAGPHLTLSTIRNRFRTGTLPIAFWRMLLTSSSLGISYVQFTPKFDVDSPWPKKTRITGSHLSSGQWSWLSTFGGLAVEIEDNSIVLVDEPENSLHPTWQQAYVPTLIKILGKHEGCHVLIATHAPLIASGLPPDRGNIRRLAREFSADGAVLVTSTVAKNTFGWSASDTYEELFKLESTRAQIFNVYAQDALRLVREGSGTREEIARLVSALESHRTNLPVLDPMRRVIGDVLTSLDRIAVSKSVSGE